jgi:Nucleotide modification associated domain 3
MKLILSRKGFDSACGGSPSPILPDGSLCPLPIPSDEALRLKDVAWRGRPLSNIVSAITKGRISPLIGVHLDPDLQEQSRTRVPGWLPLFGQAGSAQSHLDKSRVGLGDIFLFFGWFRRTVDVEGRLMFDRAAPDLHVIFGWLQVGRILRPTSEPESIPRWAAKHPHVLRARTIAVNNTLYVASKNLRMPSVSGSMSGAGVFRTQSPIRTLTAPAQGRSLWRLPGWFYPTAGKPALSYHSDPRRWTRDGDDCYVQSVGRGQEFVLDCDHFPEASDWFRDLFAEVTGSCADQADGKRRMRHVSS